MTELFTFQDALAITKQAKELSLIGSQSLPQSGRAGEVKPVVFPTPRRMNTGEFILRWDPKARTWEGVVALDHWRFAHVVVRGRDCKCTKAGVLAQFPNVRKVRGLSKPIYWKEK